MRAHTYTLSCPVKDREGSPCCEPIEVEAWPGDPGTRWDPPTGPEVYVTKAERCDHFDQLQEPSDEHFENLLEQLADMDHDPEQLADMDHDPR